jgi:oligoendopeptidase F
MVPWSKTATFESESDWWVLHETVTQSLPAITALAGTLMVSAHDWLEVRSKLDQLQAATGRLLAQATRVYQADVRRPEPRRMLEQARSLAAQVLAATAFYDADVLRLGADTAREWMRIEPRLQLQAHYVEEVHRKQGGIASPEAEALLGSVGEPFAGVLAASETLTDAEFAFDPAVSSAERSVAVTQAGLMTLMEDSDRTLRRSAYTSFRSRHNQFRQTLSALYLTCVKQAAFTARTRAFPGTFEAASFADAIPDAVRGTMLAAFNAHLPVWHRYWKVKRTALKLDALAPFDVWAGLGAFPRLSLEQALALVFDSLAALGPEYVAAVRRGCLEEHWLDAEPREGKPGYAFSGGAPGMPPYTQLSFDGSLRSLGILTHELGHSMHSFLSWQAQPLVYARAPMFTAEVASNVHQALLRAHLRTTFRQHETRLAVLEEALTTFHRYLFTMPCLAQFERAVHARVWAGEALDADDLERLMLEVLARGYIPAGMDPTAADLHFDPQLEGITWATFSHLYEPFYVYQYATGLAAAEHISRRLRDDSGGIRTRYVEFLAAGNARAPLEALRDVGVDFTNPTLFETAFSTLESLVGEYETLTQTEEYSRC